MNQEEDIANFVAITDADPQKAAQYLRLTENNLEQAIQLYFDSPDLGESVAQPASQPPQHGSSNARDPIQIDSDEDMADDDSPNQDLYADDAEIARRMQEEIYGGSGMGSRESDVRAPLARTTETLVGGPTDLDDLVHEQLRNRPNRGRPGIFNQQTGPIAQTAIWEDSDTNTRNQVLATATGGASEIDSKSNMLAQMYRPPFEIMYQRSWEDAREEGKEQEKWLLVNVQDPAIFDCQILNRDIWKNDDIKATVRENFIFMQYAKNDPRGQQYVNYYFQARDDQDAYPHIAVVDPRTGEQVKVWSGAPVPKPVEFHAELHEFLDRYSLKANAKNPVAVRKPERKKVDINRMTEEEMLEMALQNSLDNSKVPAPREDDPDALTKTDKGKGKAPVSHSPLSASSESASAPASAEASAEEPTDSRFASISESKPHTEPPASADPKSTTRIKFTYSGQAKVRKFYLSDPVRVIYEWIKSGGWEGKEGVEFELIYLRKNLIEALDLTIQEAGLRGGVVNVEFAE